MYKYIYVEAEISGMFRKSNYKELIGKYSEEGWRFVTWLPTDITGHGVIRKVDLLFEKERKEVGLS